MTIAQTPNLKLLPGLIRFLKEFLEAKVEICAQ